MRSSSPHSTVFEVEFPVAKSAKILSRREGNEEEPILDISDFIDSLMALRILFLKPFADAILLIGRRRQWQQCNDKQSKKYQRDDRRHGRAWKTDRQENFPHSFLHVGTSSKRVPSEYFLYERGKAQAKGGIDNTCNQRKGINTRSSKFVLS